MNTRNIVMLLIIAGILILGIMGASILLPTLPQEVITSVVTTVGTVILMGVAFILIMIFKGKKETE